VRLIATSGAEDGASADGRLALMEWDSAYRAVERADGSVDTTYSLPLHGTAEVNFASVGFTGTWRSGLELEESGGHFCAVKAA
jgi:hypothetical protein